MKRFHVHVAVLHLAEGVRFYSACSTPSRQCAVAMPTTKRACC
jgi:hypothetical protein